MIAIGLEHNRIKIRTNTARQITIRRINAENSFNFLKVVFLKSY